MKHTPRQRPGEAGSAVLPERATPGWPMILQRIVF